MSYNVGDIFWHITYEDSRLPANWIVASPTDTAADVIQDAHGPVKTCEAKARIVRATEYANGDMKVLLEDLATQTRMVLILAYQKPN